MMMSVKRALISYFEGRRSLHVYLISYVQISILIEVGGERERLKRSGKRKETEAQF